MPTQSKMTLPNIERVWGSHTAFHQFCHGNGARGQSARQAGSGDTPNPLTEDGGGAHDEDGPRHQPGIAQGLEVHNELDGLAKPHLIPNDATHLCVCVCLCLSECVSVSASVFVSVWRGG